MSNPSKSPLTAVNVLVAVAIAIVTTSFWAFVNRPEQEPAWPERIQGMSFSPMRAEHDPIRHVLPTAEQIDDARAHPAIRARGAQRRGL